MVEETINANSKKGSVEVLDTRVVEEAETSIDGAVPSGSTSTTSDAAAPEPSDATTTTPTPTEADASSASDSATSTSTSTSSTTREGHDETAAAAAADEPHDDSEQRVDGDTDRNTHMDGHLAPPAHDRLERELEIDIDSAMD